MTKLKVSNKSKNKSRHTIPPVLPAEAVKRVILQARDHEIQDVRRYVKIESRQRITHAEKVKKERFEAQTYSIWDVWTKSEKYWVIDLPMNLYPQRFFPSVDYAFTFHLGLAQRIFARQRKGTDKDEFAPVWRRMDQAAEALEFAEEAEDFQAVGMRCRECLIELVKAFIHLKIAIRDSASPKLADVVHWLEKVADGIASGPKSEEIRGYLKSLSKSSWQMVNGLTHATNATRFDSHYAIAGTGHLVSTYISAVARKNKRPQTRCPRCGSYRLQQVFRPELKIDPPYLWMCMVCGWDDRRERNRR